MKRLENMCMMIETKKILSMKLLVSLKRNSKHIKLTYFNVSLSYDNVEFQFRKLFKNE